LKFFSTTFFNFSDPVVQQFFKDFSSFKIFNFDSRFMWNLLDTDTLSAKVSDTVKYKNGLFFLNNLNVGKVFNYVANVDELRTVPSLVKHQTDAGK